MKSPSRISFIRPTEDFVREAIFNILQARTAGTKVADFFAGTGALGLEALSRGAESAVFIEKNVAAVNLIAQNIEILGYKEKSRIIKGDVFTVSKKLIKAGAKFDIIFLDPPYATVQAERVFQEDFLSKLLAEAGLAAFGFDAHLKITVPPPGLKIIDERNWGKCGFLFMERGG